MLIEVPVIEKCRLCSSFWNNYTDQVSGRASRLLLAISQKEAPQVPLRGSFRRVESLPSKGDLSRTCRPLPSDHSFAGTIEPVRSHQLISIEKCPFKTSGGADHARTSCRPRSGYPHQRTSFREGLERANGSSRKGKSSHCVARPWSSKRLLS
jgi:hypothetical protein